MIAFVLDKTSGVPTYLQLVQQVRQALRLGQLRPGDRLPTVREVVEQLAINPNTALKAYRDLERQGLVEPRPGLGTFVRQGLGEMPPGTEAALRRGLTGWVRRALGAGLETEDILALVINVVRDVAAQEVA